MIKKIEKDISWLVKNWDKIPDKFKEDIMPSKYSQLLEGLMRDEHIVILLLDRQKPSVEACYSFDEERIGVTRKGKIIWGFDSGCSCPTPWGDNYPSCYGVSKEWKEFITRLEQFDLGVLGAISGRIEIIKNSLCE